MLQQIFCKYCLDNFFPNSPSNILCFRCSSSDSRRRKYRAKNGKLEGIYTYRILVEDHMNHKVILNVKGNASKLMEIVTITIEELANLKYKKEKTTENLD